MSKATTKRVLNKALLTSRDDFNSFTRVLRALCLTEGPQLIRLRDDRVIEICYLDPDEEWNKSQGEPLEPRFVPKSSGLSMRWNNDGSSLTGDDFDMIEIMELAPKTKAKLGPKPSKVSKGTK